MNLTRYDIRDTRPDLPEPTRFEWLKDQGWPTLDILRLYQREADQHQEDSDHDSRTK